MKTVVVLSLMITMLISFRVLQEQTAKIKEKKALVIEDLAQVEPAVQDAKQGNLTQPNLNTLFRTNIAWVILGSNVTMICI